MECLLVAEWMRRSAASFHYFVKTYSNIDNPSHPRYPPRMREASMTRPRLRLEEIASREERVARLVAELLEILGEDPGREGLRKTPERVARALGELTAGYAVRPADVVGDALFAAEGDGLVVVRDIGFHSLCEHHMLPFHGRVHVAYLPAERIVGLSKIPRLVEVFARRLQVQERLTRQLADALDETLAPRGVAVVVEAAHLCMRMRGVEEQGSTTRTMELRGRFADDPQARRELRAALRR
jgi:GTP cyclohydrolase I